MQAEKAKLEGDLAALQVKLDTREVQFQDAVRQLNISKFMLSESDEARDEVSHSMYYMHEMVNQSQSGLLQSCVSLQVQKLKEEVSHLKARLAASARAVSNHHYNYMITCSTKSK